MVSAAAIKRPRSYGWMGEERTHLKEQGLKPKLSPGAYKEIVSEARELEKKRKAGDLVEVFSWTEYAKVSPHVASTYRCWSPKERADEFRAKIRNNKNRAARLADEGEIPQTHELAYSTQFKGRVRSDKMVEEYAKGIFELHERQKSPISMEQATKLAVKDIERRLHGKEIISPQHKERSMEILHAHWEMDKYLEAKKGMSKEDYHRYAAGILGLVGLFVLLQTFEPTGYAIENANELRASVVYMLIGLLSYFYWHLIKK
jgi:hypothetical protein